MVRARKFDFAADERGSWPLPADVDREQLGWHLESVRTFAWALGWLPKGPDSTQQWAPRDAEAALLAEVRDGKVGETLLSADMLTDAFDYVYCARWIAVDATLKGQPVKGLHPAVLLLQHRALGWLIDGSAWDDVDVST